MAGLGEHVEEQVSLSEVTVVASDYAFSYAQVFGFSLEYTRAGGKINYLWSPFGTSDYSSLIAQIPTSLAGARRRLRRLRRPRLPDPVCPGRRQPAAGRRHDPRRPDALSARGPHRQVLEGIVSAGPIGDYYDNPVWIEFVDAYRKRWLDDGGFQSPSSLGFAYSINLQAILLALKAVDGDLVGRPGDLPRRR